MTLLKKKLRLGTALIALFAAGVFVSAGGSPASAAARCTTIITTIGTVTSTVISTVTQTVTVTTGTTGTTTTPTTTCDIIANPGDATLQAVVDTATAGKTVCLHGGTYSDSGAGGRVLLFSAISGTASAPITVTSYPGETATLCGYIETRPTSDYITVSNVLIDGSCSTQQKVQVFSPHFSLLNSEINGHQSGTSSSCVFLGDATLGIAVSPVIDHNRLHDCATTVYGHGIYDGNSTGAVITNNYIYDNGGFGIQFYPNGDGGLFANNVVDGEKTKAAVFFGGQDPLTSDNNTIRDNILTYNATYGIDATWGNSIGTGNVASHNCLYGNVSGPFGGTQGWTNQGSNVLDDPLYVNRAGKDFRLQAGAPCAGMGPS